MCSVGDRPTEVIVRGLVAWIAERREIEFLMPIDKAIFRVVSKSSGRNESERRFGLEKPEPQRKPSPLPEGEGRMGRRKLTEAPDHSGGVKTTARWQGYTKQLERPSSSRFQKWAEAGSRITGNTGKSVEDERESEGSTVAEKRSNVRGAKRPCCLQGSNKTGGKGE